MSKKRKYIKWRMTMMMVTILGVEGINKLLVESRGPAVNHASTLLPTSSCEQQATEDTLRLKPFMPND